MPKVEYQPATAEEQQNVHAQFNEDFARTKEAAASSIAQTLSGMKSYFQNHKRPKESTNREYLINKPGLEAMDALEGLEIGEKDREFDKIFDGIYVEEYKKQYLTREYIGQAQTKRAELGIPKTPGNVFVYDANSFECYGLHKKVVKFSQEQNAVLEQARKDGSLSPAEIARREKALWIFQEMDRDSMKVLEQYNYMTSRAYLMNDQKNVLIEKTSKEVYDRNFLRVDHESKLLSYQAAQYGETMANVANQVAPFDQMKTGLQFYQNELYAKYSRRYDVMKVMTEIEQNAELPTQAKTISSELGSMETREALNEILEGLSSQHRIGFHSDSDEMQQLKQGLKGLTDALENGNQKILESRGVYAQTLWQKMSSVLESAQTYLAEKDKENKSLSDRTNMGRTRYLAAQALVERLQKVQNTVNWEMAKEQIDARIAAAPDPDYRSLLEQQRDSKERLFEIANRPRWTDTERKAVRDELSIMVARQKLESEYLQTQSTNGPIWGYQKMHGDFAEKIAKAIRDDRTILDSTRQMDQKKLMRFITQHGERRLSMEHNKEMVMDKVATARSAQNNRNVQRNRQSEHKPPELSRGQRLPGK